MCTCAHSLIIEFMTSAFRKSPPWKACSKASRIQKYAFSNENGLLWTGLDCSTLPVALLVTCRLISVLIVPVLVCPTPRLALLVVDLSRLSQPFLLCVTQHFELLCSFLTCLRPSVQSFLLCFARHLDSLCSL